MIGNSGSGKTGSLFSLVSVGYKLRILDYDNGLDILAALIRKHCPDKLANVEYRTLRDTRKATSTGPIVEQARAFVDGLKLLDNWKYDSVDLGKPAAWDKNTILVIDSLTLMSEAAYNWAEPLVPRGKSGDYDKRAVFYNAQRAIESVVAMLTSESFGPNVIITSHIRYEEMPDGSKKGWPTTIGSAQGPSIPRYFNSLALCENVGDKRQIRTASAAMFDLKNPASFKMAATLPIDTGLATFFEAVRS